MILWRKNVDLIELRNKALKRIKEQDIILSDEEKNIVKILQTEDFGCQKHNVVKLMETWFGKQLIHQKVNIIGAFVVSTKNDNCHEYKQNRAYFAVESDEELHCRAINPKNVKGNNLRWDHSGLRYASAEEIDEFLHKANSKTIDRIKEILK